MTDDELPEIEQAAINEAQELVDEMRNTWDREWKNVKAEREAREDFEQ